MYNKICFCITNEQHFSISVPPSEPISQGMSTAQVLFLVSIVVSLTLFFFLDEGIRRTYLHDKFLSVASLWQPLATTVCRRLMARLPAASSRLEHVRRPCFLFWAFFFYFNECNSSNNRPRRTLVFARPFPTVSLIFAIIAMSLAAGRDCRQTAAHTVGDTNTHIRTHIWSSVSRKIDAVRGTE